MKKKIVGSLLLGLLGCTTQIPGEAPLAFSLIEPPNDHRIEAQNNQEVPVDFLWEAPENTDYFILSLRDGDQPAISVLDTIVPKNFTTLNLPQNRTLQWSVSAVNGIFKSNSLQNHRLQIVEADADEVIEELFDDELRNIAPTIIKTNPPNGEIISGNSDAYLKWDFFDEDGPTNSIDLLKSLSFIVEVDTDETFSNPRVFSLEGKNDIWVATNPNTTYHWRVLVTDGIKETEDLNPFFFKIIPN